MTIEASLDRIANALEELLQLQLGMPKEMGDLKQSATLATPTPAPRTRKTKAAVQSVAAEPNAPSADTQAANASLPGIENAQSLTVSVAQPQAVPAQTAVGIAESHSNPTLDDVRAALVMCQTKKGTKAIPQAILAKYSTNGVTGGLPEALYAKVIAECAAA